MHSRKSLWWPENKQKTKVTKTKYVTLSRKNQMALSVNTTKQQFVRQCINWLHTVRSSTGSKDAMKTDPTTHRKLDSNTMTLTAHNWYTSEQLQFTFTTHTDSTTVQKDHTHTHTSHAPHSCTNNWSRSVCIHCETLCTMTEATTLVTTNWCTARLQYNRHRSTPNVQTQNMETCRNRNKWMLLITCD